MWVAYGRQAQRIGGFGERRVGVGVRSPSVVRGLSEVTSQACRAEVRQREGGDSGLELGSISWFLFQMLVHRFGLGLDAALLLQEGAFVELALVVLAFGDEFGVALEAWR
jgi:hypothetical protein